MKQLTFVTVLLMLLSSCFYNSETGSGKIETEKRNVPAFTGIHASNAIDVEVKMGSPAIEVEADDNIIQYVNTNVSGNTLQVGIKSGVSLHNAHIKVYITVPELTSVEANSSASVKVLDPITSHSKVSFDASSSAGIDAEVDAPEVNADASSSGSIVLGGRTKNYTAKVSSSAGIKSFELMSENTDVSASSSGTAEVHASITLDAHASSSGDIEYKGGGTVKSNTNSSGSVHKKD
jgi:hypothetical protein